MTSEEEIETRFTDGQCISSETCCKSKYCTIKELGFRTDLKNDRVASGRM